MSIIDSGKANLTQPKSKDDQKRLKEFLKDLGEDTPVEHRYASDAIWDCLEDFGYKQTKADFEQIEQELMQESKNLLDELRKVLDKPANTKLKERWMKFNKQMGEVPKVEWKSLPNQKKQSESEHKAEDILTMIRQRQQSK